MKLLRTLSFLMFPLLALTPMANSQSVTGQLTGTVVDPGGAIIVGATVQLINKINQQTRTFASSSNGSFIFADLIPGDYDLKVSNPGFKNYVQKNIVIGTLEKVDVHTIKLEVGDVASSVMVQAETARVVTDSSDHATDVESRCDAVV